MNFKQWLLSENPDEISVTNTRIALGDQDVRYGMKWGQGSSTFILFENFSVYAEPHVNFKHVDLFRTISIQLKNNNSLSGLQSGIKVDGELSELVRNTFLSFPVEDNSVLRTFLLKTFPDVILGRLWKDHKIVSFWNKKESVFVLRNSIIDFVKLFGDPTQYHYEVYGVMLDYSSFIKGEMDQPSASFDQSVIHTMPPSVLKQQLMNKAGYLKSKHRDLQTMQKISTSEGFSNS